MKFRISKRGMAIVWNYLIPWILAILVLVIIVILYMVLQEKGSGALGFFKNILRFGG